MRLGQQHTTRTQYRLRRKHAETCWSLSTPREAAVIRSEDDHYASWICLLTGASAAGQPVESQWFGVYDRQDVHVLWSLNARRPRPSPAGD